MGTVYVAHDPVLGRLVAIKVFLGDLDLPDARERFIREARSAAALNHANIVTIHDFGEFSSQPYIVMEYIAGQTLAEVIRERAAVSLVEKLRWLEDLCAGVAYAHEIGVLHRDIKPTNLMIDRSRRMKILDFGVARMIGTSAKATALIGTPGYMAPEQILGSAVDGRSDVFSIGVVAYELLSYAEAFPGETLPTISHRVLNEEPAPLAEVAPDLPPELVVTVMRALQKPMDDRHPDAASLKQAIGKVRRRVELYGSDTATIPLSRSTAQPASPPGTGGGRQRVQSGGGVAQATPPPDPRRHTPAQPPTPAARLAAALERARTLLETGELDTALDSCEQALAIDASNAEALAIEQAIRAAAARRHARGLLDDADRCIADGALSDAQALIEQARWLDPDLADCARVERDLQTATLARDRQRDALPSADSAETVLVTTPQPSVPEPPADGETVMIPSFTPPPAPRPPSSGGVPRPSVDARGSSSPGAGSHPSSSSRSGVPIRSDDATKPLPIAREGSLARRHGTAAAGVADWRRAVAGVLAPLPAWSRSRTALLVASILLVIGVGAAAVTLLRPAPVPSGTLVVDAVPWAVVTAIRAEDGREHQIPPDAGTPLSIALPAGRYTVTLDGPAADGGSRTVTIDVSSSGLTNAPVTRFQSITTEEYFNQYLSVPPAGDDGQGLQQAEGQP